MPATLTAPKPIVTKDIVVERTPFFFESQGASLLVWMHRASSIVKGHGVLICPPIGHEMVHSHRSLRHLADALAKRGLTVLRFDYQGTGDSEGSDADPQLCQRWLGNVRDLCEWLRAEGDCEKVSLVGLRMGATLAAYHAHEHEVDGLVLWEPVIKGRRYVRELTALNLTAQQAGDEPSIGIEAAGFVFSHETAQAVSRLDLLTLAPEVERALVVQSDKRPIDLQLRDHLIKTTSDVELAALPGYDEMMAEPHETEVPRAAIAKIADWFDLTDTAGTKPNSSFVGTRSVVINGTSSLVQETLHDISETPDLFGIVSQPLVPSQALPWIVIMNAGAAHRIGPGRLHVGLARHFATLGYPCLRMDISGLGDSIHEHPDKENDTYAATAIRDAAIACDYLQRLEPQRPIVLMGLCSGAYAAFQAAAQLPHAALVESILINPLTFFWKDGMKISQSPTEQLQHWHYYLKALADPHSWRLLLSGKTNQGIKGTVKRFLGRVLPRSNGSFSDGVSSVAPHPSSAYSHPAKEDLSADLARVSAASRRLAMIISENDPGHFLMMYHAKRKATRMIKQGKLRCFFVNGADHTFSNETARAKLSRVLTDYLQSRFGNAG